jgi:hypothetical protein
MKTRMKLMVATMLVTLALAACDKTEEIPDSSIEGRYVGTLTSEGLENTSGVMSVSISATTEIIKTGDTQIEVHCYGDVLDTTFMLSYYDDRDSVLVCLTGEAFEEMYGHMPGSGHMMGGMMGDIKEGETEWQHHMDDEHQPGDEHFGGFDTERMTFRYQFQMNDGDSSYMLDFQGSKSH